MHKTRRSMWKQARANASFKHMYVLGFPEPFENFEAMYKIISHVIDWINFDSKKSRWSGIWDSLPNNDFLEHVPRSSSSRGKVKKAVLEKTPTGKPRQTELWKCQLIFGETWFKFFSISRKNFRPYSWYYSNLEESRCSRSATLT